jgi:hypothetical protein
MTTRFQIRGAFVTFAVLWLLIGYFSVNTPGLPRWAWVVLSTFPAGSALAAAWHLTRSSLRTYVGAVTFVGCARSIAFLASGWSWAPAAVWALMTATTGLLYIELLRMSRLGSDR